MNTIIIILLLIITSILSFYRLLASFYEIEEDYIKTIPCEYKSNFDFFKKNLICSLPSLIPLIGLTVGIICYYFENEKYFLKFSFKELINYKCKNNL